MLIACRMLIVDSRCCRESIFGSKQKFFELSTATYPVKEPHKAIKPAADNLLGHESVEATSLKSN